jgi:hypothetical protein
MQLLYDRGIVEDDDLTFTASTDARGAIVKVKLEGEVTLSFGARARVLKWMDARPGQAGGTEVLSTFYQYHAWRPRRGAVREQALLRYDQAHGEPHRHRFDPGGKEMGCEVLTLDSMPRLDAFIREVWEIAAALGATQAGSSRVEQPPHFP